MDFLSEYMQSVPNLNYDKETYTSMLVGLCIGAADVGDVLEIGIKNKPDNMLRKLSKKIEREYILYSFINCTGYDDSKTEFGFHMDRRFSFVFIDDLGFFSKYKREIENLITPNGVILIKFDKYNKIKYIQDDNIFPQADCFISTESIMLLYKKESKILDYDFLNDKPFINNNPFAILTDWGWGDNLAQLAYANNFLTDFNVILVASEEQIGFIDLLKAQPNIKNVISTKNWDIGLSRDSNETDPNATYNNLNTIKSILAKKRSNSLVLDCSSTIFKGQDGFYPCTKCNLELPNNIKSFANNFNSYFNGKTIMVQPYSTIRSSPKSDYPMYTEDCLNEIFINNPDITFLLSGISWDSSQFANMNNVINLVDKTPSMLHLFGLGSICDYNISAGNGFGIWLKIQDIPSFTISNIKIELNYFWSMFFYKSRFGNNTEQVSYYTPKPIFLNKLQSKINKINSEQVAC